MIKIQIAQQRKSHLAQMVFSMPILNGSTLQRWLFVCLKASVGLLSIKYVNGSSFIFNGAKEAASQIGFIFLNSPCVKFGTSSPRTGLGNRTGS